MERAVKELEATVRLPAEAEAYRSRDHIWWRSSSCYTGFVKLHMETERGELLWQRGRPRYIQAPPPSSRPSAQALRLTSTAQSQASQATGRALAEGMRLRALVFGGYGEAATLALVLASLPALATGVVAPLARVASWVIMGGGRRHSSRIRGIGHLQKSSTVKRKTSKFIEHMSLVSSGDKNEELESSSDGLDLPLAWGTRSNSSDLHRITDRSSNSSELARGLDISQEASEFSPVIFSSSPQLRKKGQG